MRELRHRAKACGDAMAISIDCLKITRWLLRLMKIKVLSGMQLRCSSKTTKIIFFCCMLSFVLVTYVLRNSHTLYFKPFLGPPLIFYNKVPKCASSSLLSLAHAISYENGFTIYQHQLGTIPMSKRPPKEDIAKEVDIVSHLQTPAIYARHVYFFDFREYGAERPVYINMIRDPVDRFVSHFYFRQVGSFSSNKTQPGELINVNDCVLQNDTLCDRIYDRNFVMRYFCGQDRICYGTSEDAIQLAKNHIDDHYLFIGLVEEFDNTLRILEKILPDYFNGALEKWNRIKQIRLHDFSTIRKHRLLPEARAILEQRFRADYEIYYYVKREFDVRKRFYGLS